MPIIIDIKLTATEEVGYSLQRYLLDIQKTNKTSK